jgi:hypothetical protein
MANPPPRYDKPRVFVKSVARETYSLSEARRQRLSSVSRVIRKDYRDYLDGKAREKNIISPDDDPFVSQSLQGHFVTLGPGARDKGQAIRTKPSFTFWKDAASTCTTAFATTGKKATP